MSYLLHLGYYYHISQSYIRKLNNNLFFLNYYQNCFFLRMGRLETYQLFTAEASEVPGSGTNANNAHHSFVNTINGINSTSLDR